MNKEWTDARYAGVKFKQTSPNSVVGLFDDGLEAYHYTRDAVVISAAMEAIWAAIVKRREAAQARLQSTQIPL